ncbi:DNA mismatch repair endonuclease MutL [Weissella koreensis]|uniref:DNA mismatch repair protein MutL n=1 Tax=Weissella koreensis TaxID=165096 RepID=A0A7H1MNK3_9LACO|nr:DNA mismatch repair endonuclease MutL [Weissella koreensis]AVH75838.1 DNA mismatch repair endonuclease MutL [Weissella koreensis]QGN21064.1 DNA mismatch repair endonuclease MutL [Weissella koreensis]QNT65039.1 DNA mismatch repair endonuclease MutL [Weissella koreensis]
MQEIIELSETLANQIAAGEVIERPASVVKELVENAIDAGAHKIDILIEAAGVQSIEVIDDGQGIPTDQLERAFLRHATSKIQTKQDLFQIHSLGFRGEALPSIASVADVFLETAVVDATSGAMIHIKGNKIIEKKGSGARRGTKITVSDLFFNTPARLKYLKSQSTELAKIVDIINRLAFSYPSIAFNLVHNQKQLMQTVGNGNLQQVISAVYGVSVARDMVTIDDHDADFKVQGWISKPELTRSNRSYISLLINGRYVHNFNLAKALIKGYGTRLMVGRFPMAVLKIDLDPRLVDVNVHPQKFEVRISKENKLLALIEKMVAEAFDNVNLIPNATENLIESSVKNYDVKPEKNFVQQLNTISKNKQAQNQRVNVERLSDSKKDNELSANQDIQPPHDARRITPIIVEHRGDLNEATVEEFEQKYQQESKANPFGLDSSTVITGEQTQLVLDHETEATSELAGFPKLEYLSQLHGTFLFAQGSDGLYLIDQHAAQERVKYEYYQATLAKHDLEQQKMLVPLVFEFTTVEMLELESQTETLQELGLHLENFGPNTLILREHPGWFSAGQEAETVQEMVDWLLRDGGLTLQQFREKTAIMMACKRSIKANWKLNAIEAQNLIDQLAQTKNPYNCPHGRPVVINFKETDLEKMFKRIQDSHENWVEYDNHPF